MSGKPTDRPPDVRPPDIGYDGSLSSVQGSERDDLAYALLGGRVAMLAAAGRDRPAIDGILLAAAAPATGAAEILDAGCGSGVVGLCLAARDPGARVTAIDRSADAVAETAENVGRNGWSERFVVGHADLASLKSARGFDLVLTNPPFHEPRSSCSPLAARQQARFGDLALADWLRHCLRLCRPRGRMVVILRADRIDEALGVLSGQAGDIRVLPVQPRPRDPAIRVMIHARKAIRTPARLLAGLVLHEPEGCWTDDARRVLEQGAAIEWERGEVVG